MDKSAIAAAHYRRTDGSEPTVLLLASNNDHKLREFRRILGPDFKVVSPADLGIVRAVEEDGVTYEENALKKARVLFEQAGVTTIADDSGIEVDALGGAPGIYSARYGGPGLSDQARVSLLLRELSGVPAERRGARFVAAIAVIRTGLPDCTTRGEARGSIAFQPVGDRGFGYDPVFLYPPLGRTFAELADEEKDAVSHRGKALRSVAEALRPA